MKFKNQLNKENDYCGRGNIQGDIRWIRRIQVIQTLDRRLNQRESNARINLTGHLIARNNEVEPSDKIKHTIIYQNYHNHRADDILKIYVKRLKTNG
jgi:hypothetical protein